RLRRRRPDSRRHPRLDPRASLLSKNISPAVTLNAQQCPQFDPEDRDLLEQVKTARPSATPETIEIATARLYLDILSRGTNRAFLEKVLTGPERGAEEFIVGIVPGALYREHKNTGADGARIIDTLKKLGMPVETIPV